MMVDMMFSLALLCGYHLVISNEIRAVHRCE